MSERLRGIPSIEQIRQRPDVAGLEERFGRDAVVDALRVEADALRARLRAGLEAGEGGGEIVAAAEQRLSRTLRPSLRRVINATGIILHTNLGRAPLAPSVAQHVAA